MPACLHLGLSTRRRWLALAVFALAVWGASAAEPSDDSAAGIARERAAIQSEQTRLDALFAAERARCAERFAVTACLEDVRERRRAAMEDSRARGRALDDAERRSRAAARREAVAAKQRRAASDVEQAPTATRQGQRAQKGKAEAPPPVPVSAPLEKPSATPGPVAR